MIPIDFFKTNTKTYLVKIEIFPHLNFSDVALLEMIQVQKKKLVKTHVRNEIIYTVLLPNVAFFLNIFSKMI